MFDTTVHAKTLARQIRQTDFHSTVWNFTTADKANVVRDAVAIAADGFKGVSLRCNTINGKPIYRHASLSEALLIRHISETVRRITKVRQSDRQAIVKSLVALGAEGVPFIVLKMDIKSFYESFDTDDVVAALRSDAAFSRQSVNALETFFQALRHQGISGLPRGIGLSATLSEYAMRKFDAEISGHEGVRFYSRYVDDAIVLLTERADPETIKKLAILNLPSGLALNRNKTKSFQFRPLSRTNTGATEHSIKFLGYCIDIGQAYRHDGRINRSVGVDIASSKVSRIKLRLAKAFLAHKNGGTFADLLGRVKVLTSNYGFVDSSTGQLRYSGLRYNYSLIDPQRSAALADLDRFLVNALCASHPSNRIRPVLTKTQRNQLLGLKFLTGYVDNRFFSYSYSDLQRLIGVWVHA